MQWQKKRQEGPNGQNSKIQANRNSSILHSFSQTMYVTYFTIMNMNDSVIF